MKKYLSLQLEDLMNEKNALPSRTLFSGNILRRVRRILSGCRLLHAGPGPDADRPVEDRQHPL